MWFFIVLFSAITFLCINRFSKADKLRSRKLTVTQYFEKGYAELDEDIILHTEYNNEALTSVRKVYSVSTFDEGLVPTEEKSKVERRNRKIFSRVSIRGRQKLVIDTPMRAQKRGVYHAHFIEATIPDAFGYSEETVTSEAKDAIVVYPQRIDNRFMTSMIRQGFGDFNAKNGFLKDETSVLTYAPYTGREPMKAIAWKKSTKSDDFYVKQFEPMGSVASVLIFDLSNVQSFSAEEDLIERCVSMMRVVFEYFEAKSLSYCLYTNATGPMIKNGRFECNPKGMKTKREMYDMLSRMNVVEIRRDLTGQKLLQEAVRENKGKAIAYLAPRQMRRMTMELKKLSKMKGIELVTLYAENQEG